jgi:hypothetical protein
MKRSIKFFLLTNYYLKDQGQNNDLNIINQAASLSGTEAFTRKTCFLSTNANELINENEDFLSNNKTPNFNLYKTAYIRNNIDSSPRANNFIIKEKSINIINISKYGKNKFDDNINK